MDKGYYWVKFKDEDSWTIGYCDGGKHLSWQVIASDEVYAEACLIVGKKICLTTKQ
jgi:hypothetical protein